MSNVKRAETVYRVASRRAAQTYAVAVEGAQLARRERNARADLSYERDIDVAVRRYRAALFEAAAQRDNAYRSTEAA